MNTYLNSDSPKHSSVNSSGRNSNFLREEPVAKPLTMGEVERASALVKQRHPLSDTLLWQTLPFLEPVKKWIPNWVPKMTNRNRAETEASVIYSEVESVDLLAEDRLTNV